MERLAPGIEEQVVVAIRRIVRAIELQSQALVSKHGLTGPQLAVLKEIASLEQATPTVLARALSVSQPTVSGIVERLLVRGLIERIAVPGDRRKHALRLTPAGREAVARAPSLLQDDVKRRLRRLEEWEQLMLLAALQRVASLMDAEAVSATPFLTPGAAPAGADVDDGASPEKREVTHAKSN
jgi:DNA-binding MarR family transcriptional regulator